MLINCTICSDLFTSTAEVFVTPCGHMFHYVCLMEWIERSKSCPQCRSRTTDKSIKRVYFNVQNSVGQEPDLATLQHKVDNLHFEIRLKETEIKTLKEKEEILNNQNQGLREELLKVEGRIPVFETTISALKVQIKYLKQQSKDAENAKMEAKILQQQVAMLRSVETLIDGSAAEVDELLRSHSDKKALHTYVTVLKKLLTDETEKKKHLRERLRNTEFELAKVKEDYTKAKGELCKNASQYQHIEEDVSHLETENKNLRKKIQKLQDAMLSPSASSPRESALKRLLLESPTPEEFKPTFTQFGEDENTLYKHISKTAETNRSNKSAPESPYLRIKSSSVIGLSPMGTSKLRVPQRMSGDTKFSIFKKEKRTPMAPLLTTSVSEGVYDGLGGHSKVDEFPIPGSRPPKSKKLAVTGAQNTMLMYAVKK